VVIGSRRRFGVELETSNCRRYRDLNGGTIWECKVDCSIEGREFVSPILYGDEGLAEINNFCQIAHNRHWRVDRFCGYHAHFDVSTESWESLRSIAYAYRKTYDMWCRLVPEQRAHNPYCGPPGYSLDDILGIKNACEFEYFAACRDRFEFANWRAFLVHGSLELRTHEASLDASVICNWVKLHARFIDCMAAMSLDDIDASLTGSVTEQYAAIREYIGEDLWNHYADCADNYGSPVRPRLTGVLVPPF